MKDQLFIPSRIKVGFNNRSDTYTKMLAYVIYYDAKGKIRKEKSWESWRDKKIAPVEYDNKPMEGFVLNRNVGGARQSYGWNARVEKVRCFDPRGFEFEIDLPNLLFILQECTSTKGKGLEGEFVYAFNGPNILLIPTSCKEYQESQKYTEGLSGKVSTKELVPGCIYRSKAQAELVYLGKFNYCEIRKYYDDVSISNGHVFVNIKPTPKQEARFVFSKTSELSARLTETPTDNFAELMDEFNKSDYCATYKNLSRKKYTPPDDAYVRSNEEDIGHAFLPMENDDTFRAIRLIQVSQNVGWRHHRRSYWDVVGYKIALGKVVTFADGEVKIKDGPDAPKDDKTYSVKEVEAMDLKKLFVSFSESKALELKV